MANVKSKYKKKNERSGSKSQARKNLKNTAKKVKKATKKVAKTVSSSSSYSSPKSSTKKTTAKAPKPKKTATKTPSFTPSKATHTDYNSFKKSSLYNKPKTTNTSKTDKKFTVTNTSRTNGLKSNVNSKGKERRSAQSKAQVGLAKNPVALGVLEELSWQKNAADNFGNKEATKAAEKTRKTKAYKGTYAATNVAEYLVPGNAGIKLGKALVKKGAKNIVKKGIKNTAKAEGKNVTKNYVAKKVTKEAVDDVAKGISTKKKFASQRAADVVTSAPLNLKEARKQSIDEKGNVDNKALAKNMAIQTGIDLVAGGVLEGASVLATSKQGKKYLNLIKKARSGQATEKELSSLKKLNEKLSKKAKDVGDVTSNTADKYKVKARSEAASYKTAENITKSNEKGIARRVADSEAKDAKYRAERTAQRKADFEEALNTASAEKARKTDIEYERNVQHAAKDVRTYREIESKKQSLNEKIKSLEEYRDTLKPEYRGKVDADISNAKKELENLKSEEQTLYRAKLSKQKYGDLTTENQPVSEVKTSSDTTTPKVEENPSKVVESPSAVTRRSETQNLNPEYSHMTDDELRDAIKEETKQGKGKWKHGANINAKAGIGGRTLPEGKRLQGEATEHFAKAKAMEKELAERNLSDNEIRLRETEQLRNELDNVNEEIRNKEAILNDEGYSGFFTSAEEKVQIKKDLEELNAKKTELESKINEPKKAKEPEGGFATFGEEKDKEVLDELFPKQERTKTPEKPAKAEDVVRLKAHKVSRNKIDNAFTTIRRLFESSLVGVEKVANKLGDKELLNQANNVYLSKNRAAAWITQARSSLGRNNTGKSLNAIFEDFGLFGKQNAPKNQDFQDYLIYKHAKDRLIQDKPVHMNENFESVFSYQDYDDMIKEIVDRYGKEELDAFEKEVRGYFDDLMQFRVDSGLLSKETADTFNAMYPHYVPTHREFDEVAQLLEGSKKADIRSTVNTATGGTRQIEDLYQQMVRATDETIRNGEQNKMMQLYAKALGIADGQLPKGATLDDLEDVAITSIGNDKRGYKVNFFVNGEAVTIPVDKQIAKGIRELNGQDYTRMLHAGSKMSGVSKAYKGLITDYNLIFGVRNGMRDFQQALINSKNTKAYVGSIGDAWSAIANKNNPYRKLYEENGGRYSSLVKQGKDVKEPGSYKNGATEALDKTAGAVLRKIEDVNGAIEIAPRLSEFIGTLKTNADKVLKEQGSSLKDMREQLQKEMFGGTATTSKQIEELDARVNEEIIKLADEKVINEAMRNASDITLNFSRSGVIGRALNMGFTPYFNPSIQGLSKTIRLFSEANGEGSKALLNLFMKIGAFSLAPAVFNEAMLAGNEAYQMLNTRDKDTNYFIPIGDGKFIKIPKPREAAVLAEPVEYALRYCFDKAQIGVIQKGEYSGLKDLKQMFVSAADNIAPVNPLSENIFSPLVNTAKNKTWYGGSIESTSDVFNKAEGRVKNSEIADERTSAIAKQIGQMKIGDSTVSDISHLSPKKIDNLMDSYLGVIYDLGVTRTSSVSNGDPIVNQFIKDSVFSNKKGTELWAEFDKANASETFGGKVMDKAKNMVFGNTALGLKQGKTQKAKDFLNTKGYDDITYSDAIVKMQTEENMSEAEIKKNVRILKKAQNSLRNELVYGSKEVSSANDPLRTIAKIVGVDKAMKKYTYTYVDPDTGEKKNQHLDAYKEYKKTSDYKNSKDGGQKFLDMYCNTRYILGKTGESKSFPLWNAVAVTSVFSKGNNDAIAKSYGVNDETLERAKLYKKYGFKEKNFINTHRTVVKGTQAIGGEYSTKTDYAVKTMMLSDKKYRDGAFWIENVDWKMNQARCLSKKYGWTYKEIAELEKKNKIQYVSGVGYSEDNVKAAIDGSRAKSSEEKAALWQLFFGTWKKNPYGSVGDYSQKNDTGIVKDNAKSWGYGGYGRHGWGHGGGGGSSSSETLTTPKGSKKKASHTKVSYSATKPKVTDPFEGMPKSNLDNAYRAKLKKALKQ